MNYHRFITRISAARKESPIRKTTQIAQENPNFLNLASGLPNPKLFPFMKSEFVIKDGHKISLSGKTLDAALQYSGSQANPGLSKWLTELHKHYHDPPLMSTTKSTEDKFGAIITNGCQDGLAKVFEMLVSPGDNVLMENPSYPGVIAMLNPIGCKLIGVSTDQHGVIPDSLRHVMSRWGPEAARDAESDIPKVLYTVPTGSNPTGSTAPLHRKHAVYEIAQKYDLVIVEDDPYFFLQFQEPVPSYQSIDVDGRVIRADSFSKILSSGIRLGWISGANTFIQRLVFHQQASCLHTSTLLQIVVHGLLDHWGLEGFRSHVKNVQEFYEQQKNMMAEALATHLTGLAEWSEPQAGMFFWVKLTSLKDSTHFINHRLMGEQVIMLPGGVFQVLADGDSPYFRASYSFASQQQMHRAFETIAKLLRENS